MGLPTLTRRLFGVGAASLLATPSHAQLLTGVTRWRPAGGVAPPYTGSTWNPADVAGSYLVLSNNNLSIYNNGAGSAWITARATTSHNSGKYYFEIKCSVTQTDVNTFFGICDLAPSYLGAGFNSGGIFISTGGGFASGGVTYVTGTVPNVSCVAGDVLSVAVDFTPGNIWTAKNNTWASGNPGTGTTPTFTFTTGTFSLFPAISLYASTSGTWDLQSTASKQTYTPPTGFTPWG